MTVNGRRPVVKLGTTADYNILGHGMIEINGVDGLVFENIDIDGTGGTVVDRAGFYVADSSNVTLRNSRVHGFQTSQHNGVFGAGANSGYLHLDNVRLYENGGWDGPAHNVYGVALRYGAEGMDPARAHSVVIDHNTFIARSPVWDDSGHRNVPIASTTPRSCLGPPARRPCRSR